MAYACERVANYAEIVDKLAGPIIYTSAQTSVRHTETTTATAIRYTCARLIFQSMLNASYRIVCARILVKTLRHNYIRQVIPNSHRRRRRNSTVELSCVGVGGVYWALDAKTVCSNVRKFKLKSKFLTIKQNLLISSEIPNR